MHSIFHDRTRPPSKVGTREIQMRKLGIRPEGHDKHDQNRIAHSHLYQGSPGEAGMAAVADDLYQRVTHCNAQIGANVGHDQLRVLESSLLKEANYLIEARQWEGALNVFTHALAVCEKAHEASLCRESQTIQTWAKSKVISEKQQVQAQATIVQNIGYCLHCLGELEAAKEYYTQAARLLVKARKANAFIDWWRYGEETEAKLQTIRKRLEDISEGNRPYDHANEDRELPYWHGSGALSSGDRSGNEEAPRLTHAHERREVGEGSEIEVEWSSMGGVGASWMEQDLSLKAPDNSDAAETESARKEWLQYHLQMNEWEQAAELVRTTEEGEDLEYLKGRAKREAKNEL